ncbi:unnamed protein product [Amoebophrya sp. A120]|nr:unnamed protein product [Amoebophrya sp. A120]|eukprot:GSA120T00025948001.1
MLEEVAGIYDKNVRQLYCKKEDDVERDVKTSAQEVVDTTTPAQQDTTLEASSFCASPPSFKRKRHDEREKEKKEQYQATRAEKALQAAKLPYSNVQRFTWESQFLQSLLNPRYLQHVVKKHVDDPDFRWFLRYLLYFRNPTYKIFLDYPVAVELLEILLVDNCKLLTMWSKILNENKIDSLSTSSISGSYNTFFSVLEMQIKFVRADKTERPHLARDLISLASGFSGELQFVYEKTLHDYLEKQHGEAETNERDIREAVTRQTQWVEENFPVTSVNPRSLPPNVKIVSKPKDAVTQLKIENNRLKSVATEDPPGKKFPLGGKRTATLDEALSMPAHQLPGPLPALGEPQQESLNQALVRVHMKPELMTMFTVQPLLEKEAKDRLGNLLPKKNQLLHEIFNRNKFYREKAEKEAKDAAEKEQEEQARQLREQQARLVEQQKHLRKTMLPPGSGPARQGKVARTGAAGKQLQLHGTGIMKRAAAPGTVAKRVELHGRSGKSATMGLQNYDSSASSSLPSSNMNKLPPSSSGLHQRPAVNQSSSSSSSSSAVHKIDLQRQNKPGILNQQSSTSRGLLGLGTTGKAGAQDVVAKEVMRQRQAAQQQLLVEEEPEDPEFDLHLENMLLLPTTLSKRGTVDYVRLKRPYQKELQRRKREKNKARAIRLEREAREKQAKLLAQQQKARAKAAAAAAKAKAKTQAAGTQRQRSGKVAAGEGARRVGGRGEKKSSRDESTNHASTQVLFLVVH